MTAGHHADLTTYGKCISPLDKTMGEAEVQSKEPAKPVPAHPSIFYCSEKYFLKSRYSDSNFKLYGIP